MTTPSDTQVELAAIWKKFLRLTRGRVSALRALRVIEGETANPSLKKMLCSIRCSVENGSTLSEAAGKHPSVFSRSVLELLKSAEKTGAWDEILQEIIGGLEDGTFE